MTQQKLHSITKAGTQIIWVLMVLLCKTTVAQEIFVPPPSKLITKVPFRLLSGGIIILNAKLGDFKDTLNFVLDTGSGGISLDSATAVNLKLVQTPSNRTIRGIAGVRKVNFVNDQTLRFPELSVHHLNFHINDYELLTSVYGVRIDGIIGYSFLSRYIVKLNYDENIMEIWQPGTIKYPRGGYLLRPKIKNIPVFGVTVRDENRVNADYFFDIGAGLVLLMSEDFVKDSAILKKKKNIIVTQGEGLGGKKQMKVTTVRELRIGPYKFRHVPAHIFEDEYNVTNYPVLGGLIGNDLLRRFNLILNYGTREIHMTPNSHFFEQFDYSYTGMGIYVNHEGKITIEDVIKDSPGEKAGLKAGDIIIAIDNNFSQNIQAYKIMLQAPGARLKIIISRDGILKSTDLTVKSIR